MTQECGTGVPPEEGLYFLKGWGGCTIGFYTPGYPDDPLSSRPCFTLWDFETTWKIRQTARNEDQWDEFVEALKWIRIPRPKWGEQNG